MDEAKIKIVPHEIPDFRYDENGLHVTRGSAWSGPGCHDGCGVLIYTDDEGKVVKVEGDPENPYNAGRLCVRCLALPDVANSPKRLRHPMKRKPKDRGKDAWEEITWDEAFDLIYKKFSDLQEKYGTETISCCFGTGRDIGPWLYRLAYSMGTPNTIFTMGGMSCYLTRVLGCIASTGAFWVGDYSQQFVDRYDNQRWKCPDTIVIWGNNPIVSNSDGLYGHWVVDVMKRGAKLIVIDPRMTWLGSKADIFMGIRPGTDGAMALGLINVVMEEKLWDKEFVEKWCYGFDELAETARQWTPERVSEITYVPAEKIREAARMIAQSDGAILQWGVAFDMSKEALPASQAAFALFAITGQIDRPGGMVVPTEILRNVGGWGYEELILGKHPEVVDKRIGKNKYGLLNAGIMAASTDMWLEQLETGVPYKLSGLWIQTTNFLACTAPDPKRTLAACNTCDFIVAVDMFMTPTIMALADVVLPVSTFTEKAGIRIGDGFQRIETINKAADAGDTKSDIEINLELGKRFDPKAWPWDTPEEVFTAVIQECGGLDMSYENFQEIAPAYQPFEYYRYEKGLFRPDGKPGFNTQTGRIELWSTFYDSVGLPPLPYFEEPAPGPVATPEMLDEYPLILTTGARNWWSFHSEHRMIDSLRKHYPYPILQMHPDTAAELELVDGCDVWVENHRGRCKRKLQLTKTIDPRYVNSDHGWWLPEEPAAMDEGLFRMWDTDVNALIKWQPGRAGVGTNYKTMLCKVYPVRPGDEHNEWDSSEAYAYKSKEDQ
ncbi:MAG: molybdopterin-dependent oxidoreductase [Coriobacteriales bacterium]